MNNFKIFLKKMEEIPAGTKRLIHPKEATDIVLNNGKALSSISRESLFSITAEQVEALIFSNGDVEKDLSIFEQIHVIYSFNPDLYHPIK